MKLTSIIFNSLGGVTNELFKVERPKTKFIQYLGKKNILAKIFLIE